MTKREIAERLDGLVHTLASEPWTSDHKVYLVHKALDELQFEVRKSAGSESPVDAADVIHAIDWARMCLRHPEVGEDGRIAGCERALDRLACRLGGRPGEDVPIEVFRDAETGVIRSRPEVERDEAIRLHRQAAAYAEELAQKSARFREENLKLRADLAKAQGAWPPSTLAAATEASRRFGHPHEPVFNTANFQQVVAELFGVIPGESWAAEVLSREPRIVRLDGGCHWLILPDGYSRHGETA
jgi:hypothetical protein